MTNRLADFRKKVALTQKELGVQVGISKRTIEKYESGELDLRNAQAIKVLNICDVLGCDIKELLGLNDFKEE